MKTEEEIQDAAKQVIESFSHLNPNELGLVKLSVNELLDRLGIGSVDL